MVWTSSNASATGLPAAAAGVAAARMAAARKVRRMVEPSKNVGRAEVRRRKRSHKTGPPSKPTANLAAFMIANLQRILLIVATGLIGIDLAWGFCGHFDVDVLAYGRLGLISLGMAAGGLYYQNRRAEPALAAAMLGTAFLCAFSAAASLLNYFLLTVAGRRIDDALVAADRALGFDWYNTMVAMSHHVMLNEIFFRVYNLVLPQIALVLIALAWSGH